MQVPATVMSSSLVARTAFCAAANLTTNEMLRWQRFDYLTSGKGGGFSNAFDAGPIKNCLQFWAVPQPDWTEVYHSLKQADGRVPKPPLLSVTTLLQLAQRLAQLLPQRGPRQQGGCGSQQCTSGKCCSKPQELQPPKCCAEQGQQPKAASKQLKCSVGRQPRKVRLAQWPPTAAAGRVAAASA